MLLFVVFFAGCSTFQEPKVAKYSFPREAFIGDPKREFQSLGMVRTKVNYKTLNSKYDETFLCKNYFHKAVRDLVRLAKKQGADAVVDVKSVVFLMDGRVETFTKPECSDEGEDGQVLAQGIAVKWKATEVKSETAAHGTPAASPTSSVPTPVEPAISAFWGDISPEANQHKPIPKPTSRSESTSPAGMRP